MPLPKASRKAISFILITVFIDTVGLGIIIPVMPELILELTGEGLSSAAVYAGWLLFIYALMQFFCAPLLGNLSDRFGRRPILLVSLFAFGVDYIIMGMAPTLLWLYLGRVLAGIAGATGTTANAFVADVSSADEKAQNFGLLGAAWGLGFIVGPVIGGILGEYGSRIPFFAAAGLAFLNMAYGYLILPESLPKEARRSFSLKRANPAGAVIQMRQYPVVFGLIGVMLLLQIAHDANPAVWTYYTIEKFNWTTRQIGYSLGFVGIMIALVQGGLIRAVIPRIGEFRTVFFGLALMALGFFGFSFSNVGWLMYVFILPFSMAGLAFPAIRSIMSNRVPENVQGELQGALTSLVSLTAIVSPLIMTNLFGYFSRQDTLIYFPGAPFFIAGLLVIAAVAGFSRVLFAGTHR
jgi:DHA1 family tetracycline resistance protein-like MFS transporter